jgi:nucleoid-associated protein YgaU
MGAVTFAMGIFDRRPRLRGAGDEQAMATPASAAAGASHRAILLAGLFGAAIVAGAIGYFMLRPPMPEEQQVAGQAAPAPVAETGAPVVDAAPAPQPAPETVAEVAPAPEAEPEPAPAPETPAAAPVPPRIDVVRVEADGSAVIAGRAAAGVDVVLRLDGAVLTSVPSDGGGNFVALLLLEPSDQARVLSLESVAADGSVVVGQDTVLIAPFAAPEAPQPAPLVAQADPTPPPSAVQTQAEPQSAPPPAAPVVAEAVAPVAETVAEAVTETAAEGATEAAPEPAAEPIAETVMASVAEPLAAAPEAPPQTDSAAQAPAVVIASQDGIRVVQGNEAAGQADDSLQLDAITYDVAGAVTLAGRGPVAAPLRVTVDDRPVVTGEVAASGQWSLDLVDVAPGTYTLRVEQLDAAGRVADVVETPFLREDPARIRDNPMMAEPGSSVITVQQGFTLWGIAKANFGNGILYVQIFQENRGDIRDPDLIYPGQIFTLPDLPRTSAVP